ncbi:hypothetical protein AV530_013274 [Patagioenas fasciata monilis]|uniref:Uncharacterized protein n=1 Tax=Patagioenas fasciata monilis TaxID=372326 RepID=A0A1V4JNQ8_PATFA|nr:hypothetical protein AV530_013274 [Patagioenas fasciata monilis]
MFSDKQMGKWPVNRYCYKRFVKLWVLKGRVVQEAAHGNNCQQMRTGEDSNHDTCWNLGVFDSLILTNDRRGKDKFRKSSDAMLIVLRRLAYFLAYYEE